MSKIKSIFLLLMLAFLATNCTAHRSEWMKGPRTDGITSYDTCFKCGERIMWIEPERFFMQKNMASKGQTWTSDKYLDW